MTGWGVDLEQFDSGRPKDNNLPLPELKLFQPLIALMQDFLSFIRYYRYNAFGR
jgi:hypothetical protein